MELKLQPALNQKMILSQGMLQSLDILGYSAEELNALLIAKQEKNPFLKVRYDRAAHTDYPHEIKDSTDNFSQQIMDQLLHLNVSKRLTYITKLVLADLSETGFLTQSPSQMAGCFFASVKEIQEALRLLKQCEPEGLGCASLQEFLVMQAESCPNPVKDVLQNHYELFLHQKWIELTRRTGYTKEEIKLVCTYVSKMKTRPLSGVPHENLLIRPDVSVSIVDGKPYIRYYEHAFPQTFFDFEYGSGMMDKAEVNRYLKSYYKEAKSLKDQLELRKETVRRITEEIVEKQQEFFKEGPELLKSLTMTELSRKLNLHVSTVSRAVREKYMTTPYGTFAFRHFFTVPNQFLDETKMTVNSLKKRIFAMINAEDGRKPISDQEIVNRLKNDGIDISRRVVAKYRHQLNVPGSAKRKELFLMR